MPATTAGAAAALALLLPATIAAALTAAIAGTAAVAALTTGDGAAASGAGAAAGTARNVKRCLGRNGALVGEAELLQHELLASGGEVRQRVRVDDVVVGAGEAGVEAAKLRMSSESVMVRPTSQSASAVAFIRCT